MGHSVAKAWSEMGLAASHTERDRRKRILCEEVNILLLMIIERKGMRGI